MVQLHFTYIDTMSKTHKYVTRKQNMLASLFGPEPYRSYGKLAS
jgi:hypothetical protein